MPLGDSITDGMKVAGGYRSDLWQLMSADGYAPNFVGSRTSGPAQLGDRAHEGHPGWRIDQLKATVRGWLLRYRPQIVLLHIGSNDIIQNYRLATAPRRLGALVDRITTVLPGVRLYVATIVPFADPIREARATQYNAAISEVVARKAAANHGVHLVDLHSALTAADLSSDGVHPDSGGFSKMAARWYGALTSSQLTRWEAEDPLHSVVNNGERLPSANASGNGKVGYLDASGSSDEFIVSVPTAGPYRLYIRAADGTPTWCGQLLTVNGGAAAEIRYRPYGWDHWTITGADIRLRAGDNTVRLARYTCGVELDSIDLAPRTVQAS
jgi:lysophospholipase L1-like esterase